LLELQRILIVSTEIENTDINEKKKIRSHYVTF